MIAQRSRLRHPSRRPHTRRNRSTPGSSLALNPNNHTIPERAHFQARLVPHLKMLGGVDRTADVPLGADGPVLREGRRADDRGRVDAPLHPDFIRAAVRVEGPVAGVVGVV